MSEPEWELPAVVPPAWIAGAHAGGHAGGVEVEMHESPWPERAGELMDKLHEAGTLAEFYEMFAAEHGWPPIEGLEWGAAEAGGEGILAATAPWVAGIGHVAMIAMVIMELHTAFGTGERVEAQSGFVYGLMWEVTGHVDVDRDQNPMTAFQPHGWDSADDLRGAWNQGVAEGREMARDPKVHEAIGAAIRYEHDHETKASVASPEQKIMNMIWEKVHGKNPALEGTGLSWEMPGYRDTPFAFEKK
jgi:hypothetical protein